MTPIAISGLLLVVALLLVALLIEIWDVRRKIMALQDDAATIKTSLDSVTALLAAIAANQPTPEVLAEISALAEQSKAVADAASKLATPSA